MECKDSHALMPTMERSRHQILLLQLCNLFCCIKPSKIKVSLGGVRDEIQITATHGHQSCNNLIIPSTCDKAGSCSGGKRFRCEPVEGKKMTSFDQNYPISRATYTDVTRC